MSAKTAPRVTPLTVCWIRTSCQSNYLDWGGAAPLLPQTPPPILRAPSSPSFHWGGAAPLLPQTPPPILRAPSSPSFPWGGAAPLLPQPPPPHCSLPVPPLPRPGLP